MGVTFPTKLNALMVLNIRRQASHCACHTKYLIVSLTVMTFSNVTNTMYTTTHDDSIDSIHVHYMYVHNIDIICAIKTIE